MQQGHRGVSFVLTDSQRKNPAMTSEGPFIDDTQPYHGAGEVSSQDLPRGPRPVSYESRGGQAFRTDDSAESAIGDITQKVPGTFRRVVSHWEKCLALFALVMLVFPPGAEAADTKVEEFQQDSVTSAYITDGTIATVDIANNAITDAKVVDTITVNLAATATALAANPADCAANQFATTIAASGALTCAAITDAAVPNTITIDSATNFSGSLVGDVTGTQGATVVGNDSHTHNATTISGLGAADISGLGVADFTSADISQWTNNSGYITGASTLTGLVQSTASGTSYITGGNVGIGTTSPGYKLTIRDASTDGAHLSLRNEVVNGREWRLSSLGSVSSPGVGAFGIYVNTYNGTGGGTNDDLYTLVIQENGNVGIGTTSPGELLHISGASGDGVTPITLKLQSTTDGNFTDGAVFGRIDFHSSDLGGNIGNGVRARISAFMDEAGRVSSGGDTGLQFLTAGTSLLARMTILANGNVGIGTTSPSTKLDVESTSGLMLSYTSTDTTNRQETQYLGARTISGMTEIGRILFGPNSGTANTSEINWKTDGITNSNTELVLGVRQGGIGKALILSGSGLNMTWPGNVGIGTTGPSRLLHVMAADTTVGENSGTNFIIEDTGDSFLSFVSNAVGSQGLLFADAGGNSVGQVLYAHSTDTLTLTTGQYFNFAGGNVGIGTTAPAHQLHLNRGSTGTVGLRMSETYSVGGNDYWDFILDATTGDLALSTNGNGRVYFREDGNVGIGTTSPTMGKLEVNGEVVGNALPVQTIRATKTASQSTTSTTFVAITSFNPCITIPAARSDSLVRVYGQLDVQAFKSPGDQAYVEFEVRRGTTQLYTIIQRVVNKYNALGQRTLMNSVPIDYWDAPGTGTHCYDTRMRTVLSGGTAIISGNSATSLSTLTLTEYRPTPGADVAEWFPAADDVGIGDIVSIDPENNVRVVKSSKAYDPMVAGIVSTDPYLFVGPEKEGSKPVALSGRVPTNVSLVNGEIERGDLITTSSIPGVGMKATEPGAIVGIALESLSDGETCGDQVCGTVIVLLNVGEGNVATRIAEQQERIASLEREATALKADHAELLLRVEKLESKIK